MIRKLQDADIDRVADIWLDTNVKAHDFIDARYWKDNYKTVKEMLLQATVYVYEEESKILGFIGLSGEYIAGIFVSEEAQSGGVGKQLMDFVKDENSQLNLSVYQKIRGQYNFIKESILRFCGKTRMKILAKRNIQ